MGTAEQETRKLSPGLTPVDDGYIIMLTCKARANYDFGKAKALTKVIPFIPLGKGRGSIKKRGGEAPL